MKAKMKHTTQSKYGGFTIVELLIVIVVIAILAAITTVAFAGVQDRAAASLLQSDLKNANAQLGVMRVDSGNYPSSESVSIPDGIKASGGNSFQYTSDGATYCLTAFSARKNVSAHYITQSGVVTKGACTGHSNNGGGSSIADGSFMQDITSANCPSNRTRAVDARDNHTYWVQKLADGKCWMLTNLAYAGGGTNTFNDTRTLGTGGGPGESYTNDTPFYYAIPDTTNYTTEPTAPSTSTDGLGQYGYLYNFCGATGGQAGNGACGVSSSAAVNTSVSACPSGWRLPTGGSEGEFSALNTAINGGATDTDAGLRTVWLGKLSGNRSTWFTFQDTYAYYWASTQTSDTNAHILNFSSTTAKPTPSSVKYYGFAVRCLAN